MDGGFLDALAAATPTPGGGAAGCEVAAIAAALVEMCAGLAARKGRPEAGDALPRAAALRRQLRAQAAIDGDAYAAVLTAYRRPKDDPQRAATVAAALRGAALSPLRALELLGELAALIGHVEPLVPAAARSDFEAAVVCARAAADVEARNVRVNLQGAAGAADIGRMLEERLQTLAQRLPEV